MDETGQTLKLGIIGCGHWGSNYVRNFLECDGVELVAVADLDTERTERFAGRHSRVRIYSDYKRMLSDNQLGAVVVTTNASSHFEIISDCLDAGMDILAEKPMTITVAEADMVIEKAAQGGQIVMAGHTFVYNQAVRKVKEMIDEGRVGQIYYMRATRTHLGLIRQDVNVVWDLAPHDISIFNYLLGKSPVDVRASGARILKGKHEDVAFVNLIYPGNVLASIHVSWVDSNKQRCIEIVGSKARVVFDDLNLVEPVRVFEKGIQVEATDNFGDFKYAIRDGDIISPKINSREPLRTMCEHFVTCVRERIQPDTPALDGRNVVSTLCEIERVMWTP